MLYGSNLYITYNESAPVPWFCPKEQNHELLWFNTKYILPPIHKCFFHLLTTFWDHENNRYIDFPGTTVDVPDFGGEESVTYIDDGILGHRFVESIKKILEKFKSFGYKIKENLFTAPYDWRLAPVGIPEFFPKLKALVEEAYHKNNGEKVVLFGFSCGGMLAQKFLSEQSEEWKQKYVSRAVLLAPSFGGTGDSVDALVQRYSPLFYFVHNEEVGRSSASMPCIHCHLPNHVIYENYTIIIDKDRNYSAAEVRQALADSGRSAGDELLMLDNCQDVMPKKAPQEPGVPTYMIYNTLINTALTFDFSGGYDKKPIYHKVRGDGTVPAPQFDWACSKWGQNGKIVCHDVHQPSMDFKHSALASNPYVLDLILNLTQQDEWTTGANGVTQITSPKIEINQEQYSISDL